MAGVVGKELGITWGGDWATPDRPHFEITDSWRAPKEEEEVTQEQFNKMMDNYLASLAKQQPQAWSKEARDWAEGSGLIKGDEHGNKQYESYCSREQMVQFLYRFKDIVK